MLGIESETNLLLKAHQSSLIELEDHDSTDDENENGNRKEEEEGDEEVEERKIAPKIPTLTTFIGSFCDSS